MSTREIYRYVLHVNLSLDIILHFFVNERKLFWLNFSLQMNVNKFWNRKMRDVQVPRTRKFIGLDCISVNHREIWAISSKRYKLACVSIEDPDQPAHPGSLIRVFDGRSVGTQGSSVSLCIKLRLWSDCAIGQTDLNLHCMHMWTCFLCWMLAYLLICFRPHQE